MVLLFSGASSEDRAEAGRPGPHDKAEPALPAPRNVQVPGAPQQPAHSPGDSADAQEAALHRDHDPKAEEVRRAAVRGRREAGREVGVGRAED